MPNQQVVYDVDGTELLTTAIKTLLNQYPALASGDAIKFNTLGVSDGKAMFPTSGAIIEKQTRDILGKTTQICLYPIYVVYRVGALNEAQRERVKEWLDNLGRWLEMQPIKVGNTTYTLAAYPALTGNRKILEIKRTAPSYLNNVNENSTEDWAISLSCRYQNQF